MEFHERPVWQQVILLLVFYCGAFFTFVVVVDWISDSDAGLWFWNTFFESDKE